MLGVINKSSKINSLIGLIIVSVFLPICIVQADEKIALDYFQKAESALSENRWEQAIALYQKAIAEHAVDGELIIEKTTDKKIVPQGRATRLVENEEIKKAAYFPNQRLKEVQARIEEIYRASHPPKLHLSWISLEEPTGDNILDGGESGTIAVEIKNTGESSAHKVTINLNSSSIQGLAFRAVPSIAEISPGESIISTIDVDVLPDVPKMNQQLVVLAKDNSGYESNQLEVVLPSAPRQSDQIVLSKISIEDLNGDGLVEPTETVVVKATIANVGKGVSGELKAGLVLGENIYLGPESSESVDLGKIYPGGVRNIQFSFLTNHRFSHNQLLPIALQVTDKLGSEKILSNLNLAMNIPSNKIVVNIQPKSRKDSSASPELIDVDMAIPSGKERNPDAVAVVIGNRNYRKSGLPRVEYAHNDSRIMKDYLVKTLGFEEQNVLYYEDATMANFVELFGNGETHKGRVFNQIKPNVTEIFIYYSGHGAPDIKSRNSFFVPVDADPNYISLSGFSLDLFYQNIAKSKAKNVVVVLDTCFSGNSDGGYLLENISPAMVNVKKSTPDISNSVIFTSTRVDQVSTWFHEKKHGMFTYYFLKGLAGAADSNSDHMVTSTELGSYLKDTVSFQARRQNGLEQHPMLLQQSDIELVNFNNAGQSLLKVSDSL